MEQVLQDSVFYFYFAIPIGTVIYQLLRALSGSRCDETFNKPTYGLQPQYMAGFIKMSTSHLGSGCVKLSSSSMHLTLTTRQVLYTCGEKSEVNCLFSACSGPFHCKVDPASTYKGKEIARLL